MSLMVTSSGVTCSPAAAPVTITVSAPSERLSSTGVKVTSTEPWDWPAWMVSVAVVAS